MNNDWKSLLIVPLTFFAIAIPVLAFSSNPTVAMQFFGPFSAALIAAGAVIGNAQYQAKLTRERDRRLKQETQVERAVELYGFIYFLVSKLKVLEAGLATLTFVSGGIPTQQDKTELNLGKIRQMLKIDFELSWDRAIECGSTLPPELAREILANMYIIRHDAVAFYNFGGLPDAFSPHREEVEILSKRVTLLKNSMIIGRKKIATYLHTIGALSSISADDK